MPIIGKIKPPLLPPPPPELQRPAETDYGEWNTKYALLSSTLQCAVPLWIERLRGQPWEAIERRAKECSQVIAEHGDDILFRGKKKGDSATAFNHLAEGIACLAFAPGGVRIFGGHWESVLVDQVPARSKTALLGLIVAIQRSLQQGGPDASNR